MIAQQINAALDIQESYQMPDALMKSYMARKIGEPHEWEYIHRATWEKHNGPIPEGMCVTFKQGREHREL